MVDFRSLRRRDQRGAIIVDDDITALIDLAAQQVRYGQAEEALLLLRVCKQFRPTDARILLISAQALVALGEWEAAEAMLDAHRRATPVRTSAAALLGALAARAMRRFDAASRAFSDYLDLKREETSP